MVDIAKLSVKVGSKVILNQVDFNVKKGSFTALLGPNGSGKSTLLKSISGLITSEWDKMYINNKCRSLYKGREFAQIVSSMSQHNSPIEGISVRERITYGRLPSKKLFQTLNKDDISIVDKSMLDTGLKHLENRLLTTLSGGELQRVHLAACLAQEPKLLLLDEPTNHLDIKHQYSLLSLVRGLKKDRNMTVICVLHDMNQALQFADDIVMLKNGDIIGSGSVSTTLNEELILKTFDVDSTVHHNTNSSHIEIHG